MSGKIRCLVNTDEVESYVIREKEKRKRARLLQVRCQSKDLSTSIREAVEREKEAQCKLFSNKVKAKKIKEIESKLEEWRKLYSKCLNNIGESHESAQIQQQLFNLQQQREEINDEIAVVRGKAAAVEMKHCKNQKIQMEFNEKKKRQEAINRENLRAAKIRSKIKPKKDPIDELDLKKLSTKSSSAYGKSSLRPTPGLCSKTFTATPGTCTKTFTATPGTSSTYTIPSYKTNRGLLTDKLSSDSEVSSTRNKSRRKLRVSVGYKSSKSKTGINKSKTRLKRPSQSSSVTLSEETESSRKMTPKINLEVEKENEPLVKIDRSPHIKSEEKLSRKSDRMKMEREREEILVTLEKMDAAERNKSEREHGGMSSSPKKSRQVLQSHLERLVEGMMFTKPTTPSVDYSENHDSRETSFPRKTATNIPEVIRIHSPPVTLDSSLSPSSPDDFVPRKSLNVIPPYMCRLPTLKPVTGNTCQVSAFPQMCWVDKNQQRPIHDTTNIKMASPKLASPKLNSPEVKVNRRTSSVHKEVIRRELLRNFLENRGVQTPPRRAFTKSYVDSSMSPRTFLKSINRLNYDLKNWKDDETEGEKIAEEQIWDEIEEIERIHHQPEVSELISSRIQDKEITSSGLNKSDSTSKESVISDSQSETSLIRDERKFIENVVKIDECSRDVERIDEEKRQLLLELEEVRQRKRQLGLSPINETEQLPSYFQQENNVNVTLRRRCPPTYNRAMDITPHELSTVMEMDSPRSSVASNRRSSESEGHKVKLVHLSTPKDSFRSKFPSFANEPGILEEPDLTLQDSDAMSSMEYQSLSSSPNSVKQINLLQQNNKFLPFKSSSPSQISPLSAMLSNARGKLFSSTSYTPESISDSLMSFQQHELSAYSESSSPSSESNNKWDR